MLLRLACLILLFANLVNGAEEAPADDKAITALVGANNAFAVDLFKQTAPAQAGNMCVSAFSVSSAFGLVLAGARGETAAEIRKALRLDRFPAENPDAIHQAFGKLRGSIVSSADGSVVTIANGCWLNHAGAFERAFLTTAKKCYDAEVADADFAGNPGGAIGVINAWVEKRTQGKIKDILQGGSIGKQTAWVLANAVYFNGKWASEFKKDATVARKFYPKPDQSIDVAMMQQELYYQFARDEKCLTLEMPYIGERLSMVILLPAKADGLAELEKTLSVDELQGRIARLQRTAVILALPRFKLSSRFENMSGDLTALGMKLAFDSAQADFSGLSNVKAWISLVLHQCCVDVDEAGTVAAAATIVHAAKNGGGHPEHFSADHPFLYLIRDMKSGAFLFMGRVVDPEHATGPAAEEKR